MKEFSEFLNTGPGRDVFVFRFVPEDPCAALILAPPLFEERKSAQLLIANLARAVAAAIHIEVTAFDWTGTGDSSGQSRDIHLDSLRTDLAELCAFVKKSGERPLLFCGIRLGALLAAEFIPDMTGASGLILIAPPLSGHEYCKRLTQKALLQRKLLQTTPDDNHNFFGFRLADRFLSEISALTPETNRLPDTLPVLAVEVSHRTGLSSFFTNAYSRLTRNSELCPVRSQPFWNATDPRCPNEIITEVLRWTNAHIPNPR